MNGKRHLRSKQLIVAVAALAVIFLAGRTTGFLEPGMRSGDEAPYALAVSWQPAFCETASRKPECRSQTNDRFDAANFTLHGLWPQPAENVYCDVSGAAVAADRRGDWRSLDTPRIAEPIWRELRQVMPGTRSSLHKHEWVKHGTCTNVDIDAYYARSIELLADLNASVFRKAVANRIGEPMSGENILAAFEEAFGVAMGHGLNIRCARDPDGPRLLITGLVIAIDDPFANRGALTELLLPGARTVDPPCDVAMIDAVGFSR